MPLMSRFWVLAIAIGILSLVSLPHLVTSADDEYLQCESIVSNWAESSLDSSFKGNKLTLQDLLFFLHVPRTGGRTYFHCFLRKLYTSDQECPRSYDKLRFDPSKANCRLMVTHDDYSLTSKLPKEKTSVVTILRNPIDRVFSTYEFSVEVAARFLVHPNLSSATQISLRILPKSRGVSTLDIWPWKFLVPWMREDLFARRDARKLRGTLEIKENRDPYDMEEMVMPLRNFINDPIAHDIIHNGATFQVAGLTNNSCLPESHEVRRCVKRYPKLGNYVLEVAKRRLDNMLYVGLTEDHRKSAVMFANMVGAQVLSQSGSSSIPFDQNPTDKSDLDILPDSVSGGSKVIQNSTNDDTSDEVPSPENAQPANRNMTVDKLMEAYETCISSLWKSQSVRRITSLKRISPANFSKEARNMAPDALIQQILMLNNLDVELYKHAKDIFQQQHKHIDQSPLNAENEHEHPVHYLGVGGTTCSSLFECVAWKELFVFVTSLLLLVLLYLYVTARRRMSKLKV